MTRLGRARAAVVVVFAANGAMFGNWAVRIPVVKADLHLSDAVLGAALLVPAAGALVSMPLAGALSARFGSRPATAGSALVFFLVPCLVGLAPSLPWLVPALLVFGLAYGALDVVMNAQAVTVERAGGRPVMSSFHAAFSGGALIGSLTGALAAAADLPLAVHLGVTGLVLLAVSAPLFPAMLCEEGRAERSARERGPLFAWPRGRLLPLAVIAAVVLLAEGAVADWSAVYLRQELDAAAGTAGLAFTAFSLTMVAGRLAGDRLVAAWGRVRAVRVSASVALASGLVVVLAPSVAGVVLGFAGLGLGLACVVPLVFVAAAGDDHEPGPALAAVSTPGYVGFLLGPPAIGGLAEIVGLGAALALLPVLLAGVALLAGRTAPAPLISG